MPTVTPEKLHPRGHANVCIKCKKTFAPADRVHPVYIVESQGKNPLNPLQFGVMMTGEFELTHENCADPQLDGTVIIGGR